MQHLTETDFVTHLQSLSEASRRLKKAGKDVKHLISTEGISALTSVAKRKPGAANKFSENVEKAIMEYSLHYPNHGQRVVAKELNKVYGWKISEGGVRKVWKRHHIELIDLRLKRLKIYAAEGNPLSETQQTALAPKKVIIKPQMEDLEADFPGQILAQEIFYMGDIPGIGKIYQQIGIDVFSGVVLTKAYLGKTAITASEFLNSKVLPYYDKHKAPLKAIQTNKGLSYCGNESHPYELFLLLCGINHRVEKNVAPQLLRTRDNFLKEFYNTIKIRKYQNIEGLNVDLTNYQDHYNTSRKSTDRWRGWYPEIIFRDGARQFIKTEEPPKWEPTIQ